MLLLCICGMFVERIRSSKPSCARRWHFIKDSPHSNEYRPDAGPGGDGRKATETITSRGRPPPREVLSARRAAARPPPHSPPALSSGGRGRGPWIPSSSSVLSDTPPSESWDSIRQIGTGRLWLGFRLCHQLAECLRTSPLTTPGLFPVGRGSWRPAAVLSRVWTAEGRGAWLRPWSHRCGRAASVPEVGSFTQRDLRSQGWDKPWPSPAPPGLCAPPEQSPPLTTCSCRKRNAHPPCQPTPCPLRLTPLLAALL